MPHAGQFVVGFGPRKEMGAAMSWAYGRDVMGE